MAPEVNAVEVIVRLLASLGMVVAVILFAARALRKRGGLRLGLGRSDTAPKLDVLDRTQLTRNASVAVVRVGGRGLVVGITENTVTLLAEAPELVDRYEQDEAERTAPRTEHDAPGTTRMNFLEAMREATVRRS
ncbi:MAG: flagellar biosynthetic protein FliO [Acidimicrobiales bacterium]